MHIMFVNITNQICLWTKTINSFIFMTYLIIPYLSTILKEDSFDFLLKCHPKRRLIQFGTNHYCHRKNKLDNTHPIWKKKEPFPHLCLSYFLILSTRFVFEQTRLIYLYSLPTYSCLTWRVNQSLSHNKTHLIWSSMN
jgi:hypothetical protein